MNRDIFIGSIFIRETIKNPPQKIQLRGYERSNFWKIQQGTRVENVKSVNEQARARPINFSCNRILLETALIKYNGIEHSSNYTVHRAVSFPWAYTINETIVRP